jgi:hypothetical protein
MKLQNCEKMKDNQKYKHKINFKKTHQLKKNIKDNSNKI